MEFTKEEISLCKQVAEKHRFEKLVKEGDWIQQNYGTPCIDLVTSEYIRNILRFTDVKHWFPLWTISDCLEFLRKEGYMVRLIEYENHSSEKRIECNCYGHKTKGAFSTQGNKDEEACLKAVLAVLEEGK